jgi:hypothetical protein
MKTQTLQTSSMRTYEQTAEKSLSDENSSSPSPSSSPYHSSLYTSIRSCLPTFDILFFQAIIAGILSGLVVILRTISYAQFIFSGPLGNNIEPDINMSMLSRWS